MKHRSRFSREANFTRTYGEQHDGDSQRDGGEDGQADEQQQGVKLVDLGEGVQQLRLHVTCARRGHRGEELGETSAECALFGSAGRTKSVMLLCNKKQ